MAVNEADATPQAGGEPSRDPAGGTGDRLRRVVTPTMRQVVRAASHAAGRLTAGSRAIPDFLIIGAMRGGTTTLYHYLVRHPRVAGAVLDKEVHFFDLHHDRGERWYRARFPRRSALARRARGAGGAIRVGEATPYYLFHPLVPARVAEMLPSARVIAMLRDPVERAWSHYRHEVDLGYETLGFDEAIDAEEERLAGAEARLVTDPSAQSSAHQHHSYLARGRYAEQLERWFDAMPRERIFVMRSEDFYADPAVAFTGVLDFLGLPAWSPGAWRTLNAATSSGLAPVTRARLRAYFEPHDRRLASLVGWDRGWQG